MTEENPRKPGKGIYLLPNLFTTGGLFAGFYGIIAATQNDFTAAAIAVIIAGVCDGLDGRIARLTNTQSDFGVEYDSMADLISFGLAPAMIMYFWSLQYLRELGPVWGKIGWLAAFLYAACGALRLARFNTQAETADKSYFQGLASPAAAGLLVVSVWNANEAGITGTDYPMFALALTVVAALLMVSNVRYYSFKKMTFAERVPFFKVLLLVLIFVALSLNAALVLLVVGFTYVVSGPLLTVRGVLLARAERKLKSQRAANDGDAAEDESAAATEDEADAQGQSNRHVD